MTTIHTDSTQHEAYRDAMRDITYDASSEDQGAIRKYVCGLQCAIDSFLMGDIDAGRRYLAMTGYDLNSPLRNDFQIEWYLDDLSREQRQAEREDIL